MKSYRIPQLATNYASYDMITKHTELPHLSDTRVHLLYIFLNECSAAKEQAELYSLAASLVQLGLDTHAQVSEASGENGEVNMRSLQLKVLAGDYFSGLFYEMLAKQGEIEMISAMSREICEINVLKMNLYSRIKDSALSAEQYLSLTVQLNMQLFLSFTPLFDEPLQKAWKLLLRALTTCEILLQELQDDRQHTPDVFSFSYWHVYNAASLQEKSLLQSMNVKDWKELCHKYKGTNQLMDKLVTAVHEAESAINSYALIGDTRLSSVKSLLKPYVDFINAAGCAVREG